MPTRQILLFGKCVVRITDARVLETVTETERVLGGRIEILRGSEQVLGVFLAFG